MIKVTGDQPAGDKGATATVELPPVRSLQELDGVIEKTYGADVRRVLSTSVGDQQKVVKELRKFGLNGNAEALSETYLLHRQQLERKENLLSKTWKVVTWPFKKAWEFAKAHPFVTILLVAAVAAGGGYLLWRYAGSIIPIPNPAIGAGEVADVIAAPTGGEFMALPQTQIVPPNLSVPYSVELPPNLIIPETGIPGVPLPPPAGTAVDFFSPYNLP